jgi:DNA-directed RNA polymerase subunit RPC12/RpoP
MRCPNCGSTDVNRVVDDRFPDAEIWDYLCGNCSDEWSDDE